MATAITMNSMEVKEKDDIRDADTPVDYLAVFKERISECINLVSKLEGSDRAEAIKFWNIVTEQLQAVIDRLLESESKEEMDDDVSLVEDELEVEHVNIVMLDQETPSRDTQYDITAGSHVTTSTGQQKSHNKFIIISDSINHDKTGGISNTGVVTSKVITTTPEKIWSDIKVSVPESDLGMLSEPSSRLTEKMLLMASDTGATHLANPSVHVRQESVLEKSVIKNHVVEPLVPDNSTSSNSSDTVGFNKLKDAPSMTFLIKELPDSILNDPADLADGDLTGKLVSGDLAVPDSAQLVSLPGISIIEAINPRCEEEAVQQNGNVAQASQSSDDSKRFECDICNKKFRTHVHLTAHRWQHTKPFQCQQCHQKFSSKGTLTIHYRSHTGERPFECDKCDAKFATGSNLQRHIRTHTGIKPFECTICSGRFTEKKSLKIHMRTHTGERPFSCTICNRSFTQNGSLQSHINTLHNNRKKTHVCDICGRSFMTKFQLKGHKDRHMNATKYQCDICNYRFYKRADLQRHVKGHTDNKSHICKICSQEFTRGALLEAHMYRHYDIKPYSCKVCDASFFDRMSAHKHLRQRHPGSTRESGIVFDPPKIEDMKFCLSEEPRTEDSQTQTMPKEQGAKEDIVDGHVEHQDILHNIVVKLQSQERFIIP